MNKSFQNYSGKVKVTNSLNLNQSWEGLGLYFGRVWDGLGPHLGTLGLSWAVLWAFKMELF